MSGRRYRLPQMSALADAIVAAFPPPTGEQIFAEVCEKVDFNYWQYHRANLLYRTNVGDFLRIRDPQGDGLDPLLEHLLATDRPELAKVILGLFAEPREGGSAGLIPLTRVERTDLEEAVSEAYEGTGGIDALFNDLKSLKFDPSRGDLASPEGVRRAIEQANSSPRIADLIGGLADRRRDSRALADLVRRRLRTVPADQARARLDGMVVDGLTYRPAADWLERLNSACRWVCRIEVAASSGESLGTGFLVSDELVLTNYHVVHGFEPPELQARFDVQGLNPGTVRRVSKLEAMLPPGGNEWGGDGDPPPECLDFCLLRLESGDGEDSARGYAVLAREGQGDYANQPVIVLQHPEGAPLQVCLGTFLGTNPLRTRLFHTATTQGGASGAPCLSMALSVVGLHNGGLDKKHNTAVPGHLIRRYLAGQKINLG